MSFSVDCHSDCDCDKCGASIGEGEQVYCESCYTGSAIGKKSPTDETVRCGGCKEFFLRSAMIEKLLGPRCRKCAEKIEQELIAKLAKPA